MPWYTIENIIHVWRRNENLSPCTGIRVNTNYCKTSNISHTLEGNKIVDHSDVVGASPVGAAPTTSSF